MIISDRILTLEIVSSNRTNRTEIIRKQKWRKNNSMDV